MIAPQNKSPYSSRKHRCKGRACAKCGECRDWYWSFQSSWNPWSNTKVYTKRLDATCAGTYYGYRGYSFNYDPGYYHTYPHTIGTYQILLCECDDNRL